MIMKKLFILALAFTAADLKGSNGVVHVIDGVVLPK